MICLDTNYLILALVPGSREGGQLVEWEREGETFIASAVTWFEFVCGPVDDRQAADLHSLLREVVPFDDAQAREAARLFNACGRKRHLRVDAMIAAAATTHGAALATSNTAHFREFSGLGLRLAELG